MKNKDISDLALTSYLSAIGHKLISLKSIEKKFSFSFEDSETLQKDIMAFYNRTARVDPLTFSETFRNFKAMIRNQRGD